MKNPTKRIFSNIDQCLEQARKLNTRNSHRHIFNCLAGDDVTGLIAYAIWKERSKLLYTEFSASGYKQSGANASRVSQARSCWHVGSAAFGDLSRLRRPVR